MRYLLLFLIFLTSLVHADELFPYKISKTPWPEELGNHRAIVKIKAPANAVKVELQWRRRDLDADQKCLIITDSTGRRVNNIMRIAINREQGTFVFEPIGKNLVYYVYYMPWSGRKEIGNFNANYLKPESKPDEAWINQNHLDQINGKEQLAKASVLR